MTQFDDVLAQLGQRHQSLAVNLVQFAALLKSAGVDVTTTQVRGAAKALLCVDVTQRDDTRIALVSSLVTNHDDFSAFDALFAQFWRVPHDQDDPPRPEPARVGAGGERLGTAELVDAAYARGEGAPVLARETPPQTYSAEEVLLQKDFSTYRGDDLHNARRYLRRLGRKLSSATTRRQRASRKGRDVDLRKSLRLAARRDGEVLRLRHRRRRVRRPNLLLLCDVSGSMDVYSRFLVQFLYGMQHELRGVQYIRVQHSSVRSDSHATRPLLRRCADESFSRGAWLVWWYSYRSVPRRTKPPRRQATNWSQDGCRDHERWLGPW